MSRNFLDFSLFSFLRLFHSVLLECLGEAIRSMEAMEALHKNVEKKTSALHAETEVRKLIDVFFSLFSLFLSFQGVAS